MSNRAMQLMLALGAALFATQFAAAEGPKYTDPKQVDADFAFQGEYSGLVGGEGDKQNFGLQVIALGKGRFQAVGYFGGLPGDGWNEEKPLRAEGEVKSGRVIFLAENGSGKVVDGEIIVTDSDGNEAGKLKKSSAKARRWARSRRPGPWCCSTARPA